MHWRRLGEVRRLAPPTPLATRNWDAHRRVRAGQRRCRLASRVRAEEERPVNYNKEFGYSRKDVVLICTGVLGAGVALYYALQLAGIEPGMAGSYTQAIVFTVVLVGWVATYVYRVANKARGQRGWGRAGAGRVGQKGLMICGGWRTPGCCEL